MDSGILHRYATLARLAYLKESAQGESEYADWAHVQFGNLGGSHPTFVDHGGSQCYAVVMPMFHGKGSSMDLHPLVIGFRGTEIHSLRDIRADLFARIHRENGYYVHAGFKLATDNVWGPLLYQLENNSHYAYRPIHLVGHSLGGAMALITGSRLLSQRGYNVERIITFGCPRVGCRDFSWRLKRKTWRVVHKLDIIPWFGRGHHVGELMFVDETGTLRRKIGWHHLALSAMVMACRSVRSFRAVRRLIRDHSMDRYVQAFEKANGV